MRVTGVTAIITACAQDRRGDDPGHDQLSCGCHPDYPLGFNVKVIDSGLPGCPGCLREPLWLSTVFPDVSRVALTDTLNMFLEWADNSLYQQRLFVFCVVLFSIYTDIYVDFAILLSILYGHSCHVNVPWCIYLFGPKWSINYYYYYWKSGTSDLLMLMLFVIQCTDYNKTLTLTLTGGC